MVLAPIHSASIPVFKAASTCDVLATSVITGLLIFSPASFSQFNPTFPTPSKELGRVLGFQIPALKKLIFVFSFIFTAVDINCSFDSALHGPAIINLFMLLVDFFIPFILQ